MVPLNGRRISPIPRIRDRPRSLPPVGGHDLRVDWQLSLQQVFGEAAVQGLTVRREKDDGDGSCSVLASVERMRD